MTRILFFKLFRDLRWTLLVVMLLLGAFQFLWAKVCERILGKLTPFFTGLANLGGLDRKDIEAMVFEGPGKILKTIIGGDRVQLDTAMDFLSIGYVHPMIQIILCIWAVGRAAGAIAGEIDKGTMELLLAQPLARSRIVLAHFLIDLVTIPLLCLALLAGNCLGAWAITPIQVETPTFKMPARPSVPLIEIGPFTIGLNGPANGSTNSPEAERRLQERLAVEPLQFVRGLPVVGGLLFAMTGYTMWLSSLGRSRWRVLGLAVFVTLMMFLVNVLGQMWDQASWMRPLTVFYYYQPQQMILGGDSTVQLSEWNGGSPLLPVSMPIVLFLVGFVGYALALWTLVKRDIPAPL